MWVALSPWLHSEGWTEPTTACFFRPDVGSQPFDVGASIKNSLHFYSGLYLQPTEPENLCWHKTS